MSRKEFLTAIAAFLGVFILNRLPFHSAAKSLVVSNKESYGNNSYGGTKKV